MSKENEQYINYVFDGKKSNKPLKSLFKTYTDQQINLENNNKRKRK